MSCITEEEKLKLALSLQTVLYVFTGVLATAKSVWKAVVTDSFVYLYRALIQREGLSLAVVTDSFVCLYRNDLRLSHVIDSCHYRQFCVSLQGNPLCLCY